MNRGRVKAAKNETRRMMECGGVQGEIQEGLSTYATHFAAAEEGARHLT